MSCGKRPVFSKYSRSLLDYSFPIPLIGEELFAAGALVDEDLVSRSTIAVHDGFKLIIVRMTIRLVLGQGSSQNQICRP